MKKTLLVVLFLVVSNTAVFSQNITNTLGTNGLFTVKDATSNFLTIDQSDGKITVQKILDIKNTSNSTTGLISKEGVNFLHNYGTNNLFMGNYSGNFTMTGTNNTGVGNTSLNINSTGDENTSLGYFSLAANTSGDYNTGIGYFSLRANSTGIQNTAIGNYSLRTNTTGHNNTAIGYYSMSASNGSNNTALGVNSLKNGGTYNVAIGNEALSIASGSYNAAVGYNSLSSNTTGNYNTALGYYSLASNSDGLTNTSIGAFSLQANTSGVRNTAMGYQALNSNLTGEENTAVGTGAGQSCTGSNNTFIGYNSGNITSGNNNVLIGFLAQAPSAPGSNQVRIGNTSITYAGVQVAWTVTSDRRWKDNIQKTPLGLEFISKLNPVIYTRNNNEKQKTEFGLIAQELEKVLKEFKIENTGMLTIDDDGYYHLRYNDLLSPMIKAIQELKLENEELKKENMKFSSITKEGIDELKKENIKLKEKLSKFEQIQEMLASEIASLKLNNNETSKLTLGK